MVIMKVMNQDLLNQTYKAISKHLDVKTIYANKLIAEKVISKDDFEKMELDYKKLLMKI